jgi:DNA-binding protein H-NS
MLQGTSSKGAKVARAKSSGKTVADIDAEITRLQKERDALHANEVKEVVGRIKEAIRHYGLTAEDLGLAGKRGGKKAAASAVEPTSAKKRATRGAAKAATKKPPSPPKYSNGVDKTWSGHGKRPGWFVDALAAGKTAEDLLIKAEA